MTTVLYHIYHLAMHDKWFEARDLFTMTHMTHSIEQAIDVETKILYNRAIAQLGLAGFRRGNMVHACQCLTDLQSTTRVRELLAQGLMNNYSKNPAHERSPEEEAIQRRRLLPYHMHINTDLLDCAYTVSAMINEIPCMAQNEFNAKRKQISKQFYSQLRQAERNNLNSHPDHHKDYLMLAARAMKLGDWRKCVGYVINEKLNRTIWSRFNNSDQVIKMIEEKLKIECLRTYMFTYSQFYTNISKEWLATNFELPVEQVSRIVTKMMLEDNLQASLDGPTGTVVLHGTEPSRLQNIALQLSQKVSAIQDQNEKIASGEKGMSTAGNRNFDKSKFHKSLGGGDRDNNNNFQKGGKGSYDKSGSGGHNKGKQGGYNKNNNYNRQNSRNYNNKNNVRFEE